jgi:hypothetical protein
LWSEEDKVTNIGNDELTKPFLEDELKEALFQIERNKAAGLDGFPIEFYQVCWKIIKEDIVELFNDFYLGILDTKRLNYGIIKPSCIK